MTEAVFARIAALKISRGMDHARVQRADSDGVNADEAVLSIQEHRTEVLAIGALENLV